MRPSSWSRTKTSSTARDSPGSMVKRSRDQSTEAPRRSICCDDGCRTLSIARRARRIPRARAALATAFARANARPPSASRCPRDPCPAARAFVAAHAVVARQRVHDRVLERVAHVQRAGHVRRRNYDAIGRAAAVGREIACGFPARIVAAFELGRPIVLVHVLSALGKALGVETR